MSAPSHGQPSQNPPGDDGSQPPPRQRPPDGSQQARRPTANGTPPGARRNSWLDPNAPDGWWSATVPPAGSQVVDQDTSPQMVYRGGQGPRGPARPGRRPTAPSQPPTPGQGPGMGAQAQQALRTFAHHLWRLVRDQVIPIGGLVALLVVLALLLTFILHFAPGAASAPHHQTGKQQTSIPLASPTLAPAPTPTPTQTELDGVITMENLDANNPFVGDVTVRAGSYFCRNAPEPNSTWHIILAGGATTQVPCVIPVHSPSSLPAHTFTMVETGLNGQGRVLVDNLTPFTGTASTDH